MVNLKELRASVEATGLKKKRIATLLGITRSSLTNKLNGRQPIKIDEARTIKLVTGMSDDDFIRIFFAPEVEPNRTE